MSRLENISKVFREQNIVRNDYKEGDYYSVSHPDALSTGDEAGKGETTTIGSLTDIKTREKLVVKNIYTKNNEYNSSNA